MNGTCETRRGLRIEVPLCWRKRESVTTKSVPSAIKRRRLTHANESALVVKHHALALHMRRASLDNLSQLVVERVRKSHMADNTTLEEGERPNTLCAIDDLVRDDKVHGLDLLLERADGREGDDASDTEMAESSNVGAVGNLVRRKLVVHTVTGKESHVHAIVGEDGDGRGRSAPRRDGVDDGDGLVAFELGQAGAANNADMNGL